MAAAAIGGIDIANLYPATQSRWPLKEPPIPDIVIAVYRPKQGCEQALLELVRDHVPFLRREGLATGREPIIGQAADGSLIEVFEWATGAVARAHESPAVAALWERFAAVCDFIRLTDLAEAHDMFATLAPVD